MTVYIVNTYIIISITNFLTNLTGNDLYNVKYEFMGGKEGQNPIFVYNRFTNYHYIQ